MKNKMTEKLFELAYTDSMTEVQNRNAYEERLKKLRKPNVNISRIGCLSAEQTAIPKRFMKMNAGMICMGICNKKARIFCLLAKR